MILKSGIYNAVVVLSFFFIAFQSTLSQAHTCEDFLHLSKLEQNQTLSLDLQSNKAVVVDHNEISSVERMRLDRALIESLTNVLRTNRYSLKHIHILPETPVAAASFFNQVFKRYESKASKYGYQGDRTLQPLSESEILTHAIVLFNMKENPKRADLALKRIKSLRPATQFRYERVLINMVDFLQAKGDFEASDRVLNLIRTRRHSNQ